ncbi:unnamed protein product [Dicrocoelium dendriticum]|nr:unnamed protein product [Dicrocoelium dendriticum]
MVSVSVYLWNLCGRFIQKTLQDTDSQVPALLLDCFHYRFCELRIWSRCGSALYIRLGAINTVVHVLTAVETIS